LRLYDRAARAETNERANAVADARHRRMEGSDFNMWPFGLEDIS